MMTGVFAVAPGVLNCLKMPQNQSKLHHAKEGTRSGVICLRRNDTLTLQNKMQQNFNVS